MARLMAGLAGIAAAIAPVAVSDAAAAPVPVQPLASVPPAAHYELGFAEADVTPGALVAGAGTQRLHLSVDPTQAGHHEVVAVLYSPAGARDGEPGPLPLAAGVTEAGAAGAALELRAQSPPPGALRLDLISRDGGSAKLLARARIPVYAQHRLPPGVSPAGPAPDGPAAPAEFQPSAAGELAGGPRAFPPGAINSNLTATPNGSEAETFAALDPANANRAIAAVNPGSFNSNPPAFISDAGLAPGTVATRVLPSASILEDGGIANLRLCCDPALAADRDGNLWYASLALGRKSYIVINRVAAGTTDFQPANVAIPRHTGGLQDKPMITIDNWPQSPKYGRLYATWVENSGNSQNVVVSECDTRPGGVPDPARCDTPANWTPGSSLPDITDATGVYTYPSVAAAPNGDVYLTWWNAGRPPSGNEIEIDSCPAPADCRAAGSWGPDTTVDDLEQKGKNGIPFFCPIVPAPGGRVGPQPYVDVGPDGTVYVAYSDLRHNGKRLCTATKRDRTFDSFIAAGPTPGAYPVANTGVRLTDDGPSDRNQSFFPTLAVDPTTGEVQSSFYSTKQSPSQKTTLQYYVASTDLAATFSPMFAFSTATSNFSGSRSDGFDYGDYEGADASQGVFLPAWTDNRKQPKSQHGAAQGEPGDECEPDQEECEGSGGEECEPDQEECEAKPHNKPPRRPPDVFALTPP